MNLVKIATRNSPLALWQANFVKDELLKAYPDLEVVIVSMTTKGDQLLDRSLATVGGKGLFLKELEVSLLNKETDIAVHSMKDVPAELPDGLEISVVCEREDPRDAFVSNDYTELAALPVGACVGTASLRRVAQLKHAFPWLEFKELRGNVNTRLAKLDDGEYHGIILAAAGLKRLKFDNRIKQYIEPELCLPAVGQGIVGIECRSDDEQTKALIKVLHNADSALVLAAERAMNAKLEGGCQVPVAGYAKVVNGRLKIDGLVARVDGSKMLSSAKSCKKLSQKKAIKIGHKVAADLLEQGAAEILNEVRQGSEPADKAEEKYDKPVIILTRQSKFLGNMPKALKLLSYNLAHIETLEVQPVRDDAGLETFNQLDKYTDMIFVSRNAVDIAMPLLKSKKIRLPEGLRVMAVGKETAKQLRAYDVKALFPDQGTGIEALFNVKQLSDLKGRNVLFVRGAGGLTWPLQEVQKRGASVDYINVYSQALPSNSEAKLDKLLTSKHHIEAVLLHSGLSASNFMKLAEDKFKEFNNIRLIVGSERIAEEALACGWTHDIEIARSPTNKDMMTCLTQAK